MRGTGQQLQRKPERILRLARELGRIEDEGWRVRKDGTRFWADVVVTVLLDERGTVRGFAKVTRDLTERRQAEDALRMAHQELELRVSERTQQLKVALEAKDQLLAELEASKAELVEKVAEQELRRMKGEVAKLKAKARGDP